MIDDLKIGIYEFLLKCKPKYEEDGEYLADGTLEDHSQYHLSCHRRDMETLAYDLGVTMRDYPRENEWEAIQRYMERKSMTTKKKPKPLRLKWSMLHEAFLQMTSEQCHYPLEEEIIPPFTFCTKQVVPGSSYCPEHDRLCHPNRYKAPGLRYHWRTT